MKHSKEWHTCDRCGAEITIRSIFEIGKQITGRYTETIPKFDDDDKWAEIEEVHKFFFIGRKYELCPKCRRDFERFMRNKHDRQTLRDYFKE